MVTLFDKASNGAAPLRASVKDSYSTYQEPDTRIPPKARPVLGAISVNGVAIAESEILAEAQNHPAENPGAALLAAARALAVRELLLQRARERRVAVSPETDPEGRSETDEDAAIRRLIEEEVSVPSATAEECLRFYENNRAKFRSEPIFEASHILIAADPADEQARAAARGDAERLAAVLAEHPVEFETMARTHSACPSAAQGGNLGQLTRGSTVAEFERAMARMTEGEITTRPVESRFGYHIIRLERRIDGEQLPFDFVQQRIAGWLEASTWSKAVSQYIAILAADATITGIDLLGADGPLVQ
ncbi:peptidylprolyl isomerase [Ciceribacter ferrooxidans]|uniref:Parvulin-like PPIase n=1 Tax=Ciceribacter ferrooxidans TaxID=2509717 RepID=A0A4Q2TYI1_9HYPH|nr:peptidylprolyl isomerase [Ciceribacter ferrooxidans]RYC26307.1 peptidylprolyl isomerase [Ciceribacter ferrooxidans]